ncbi:hypothetical protein LTR09_013083 [Extremus antarcticus]|uniref:SnoaL-like domain-containing protein n=1 Tax=Extremus antarcticus TaxID=702011 RepID=A0AAJ0G3H7_9PEZI|nr:hypothetical protein LTR09_013083 [Extremus antarcticus]
MAVAMKSAVWPQAPIQQEVKDLVYRFFALVDQNRAGVGEELASNVFTSDGIFAGSVGTFKGTAELKTCRDQAWTGSLATRRHEVERVFINDAEEVDLVIVGSMTASTRDGEESTHSFLARALLRGQDGKPKIRRYQVLISGAKGLLE